MHPVASYTMLWRRVQAIGLRRSIMVSNLCFLIILEETNLSLTCHA
jgi:hypothetical protein